MEQNFGTMYRSRLGRQKLPTVKRYGDVALEMQRVMPKRNFGLHLQTL